MPTLPTSVALGTISGTISASPHNSNYGAVQTAINSLIDALNDGAAGDVLGGVGTTLTFAKPPGYEYGYDQITADVTVSSTTEAAGTTVISCAAHTFDGSAVVAEFFSPSILTGLADGVTVLLFEGATQIGRLCHTQVGASTSQSPGVGKLRFTPSAASHTYTVTAIRAGANSGTIKAGASGTGVFVPTYIRFTKA